MQRAEEEVAELRRMLEEQALKHQQREAVLEEEVGAPRCLLHAGAGAATGGGCRGLAAAHGAP